MARRTCRGGHSAARTGQATGLLVLLVRRDNPKAVRDWGRDWGDLLKPDIRIISPNPKTSGGARWSYLAFWGWALRQPGGSGGAAEPRVISALGVSIGAALVAALINLPLGLLLVRAIVRLRFPGRRLLDGAIDLPFALPTAIAGIALIGFHAVGSRLPGA